MATKNIIPGKVSIITIIYLQQKKQIKNFHDYLVTIKNR